MVKATIRASIDQDIQKIWQIVTNLQDYSWRSDLSKIEVINERQFIEYTKSGYPTTFTIIDKEPFTLYSFTMENTNMRGRWQGKFTIRCSDRYDLYGRGNAEEVLFETIC